MNSISELAPGSGTVLAALELMRNDGPWTVPENLKRSNAVLGYSQGDRSAGWGLRLTGYDAAWTSTDQVPQRLIDAGSFQGQPFGRFDSLDASDGGSTSRFSLSGEWHARQSETEQRVSAYLMRYRLALFSNFTFVQDDPVHGDQFSQQDRRTVSGLSAAQTWNHNLAGLEARTEVGTQIRHDQARVGLFHTQERQTLDTVRNDDIAQTQLGLYLENQLSWAPWLRSVAGLRWDRAQFRVQGLKGDAMAVANSGEASANLLSPKLSLVAGPWNKTEFFLNAGKGFHSNDARGTTTRLDPQTGEAVSPVLGLVASRGWEIGTRSEALPGLQSSLALWHLHFNSELVYVGDAGATEGSGASTRRGVEWNNRWAASRQVLFDADLAWTHARFDNGDRIPNAVDQVASVAATLKDVGPWSASLNWRYLGSGALVEDNSVRSEPSSTFNLRVSRALNEAPGRPAELTLDVFNLFNRRVNDIQYYYESRLPGEAQPVADRIVHPAEPRSLRLTLKTSW